MTTRRQDASFTSGHRHEAPSPTKTRWVILALLVLAGLTLLAYFQPLPVLLLVVAVVVVALVWARPFWVFAGLVALLPFHEQMLRVVTWQLGWTGARVTALSLWKEAVIALLLGVLIVQHLIGKRRIQAKLYQFDLWLLALVLFSGIYITVAATPSIGVFGFRNYFEPLAVFFLARLLPDSRRDLKRLLIVLSIIAALITDKIVEPRAGAYVPEDGSDGVGTDVVLDKAAQSRGMKFAGLAAGAVVLIVFLLTIFPGAPLRHPETGGIIGTTPFMDSLLFLIMLVFLLAGIGYGYGAGTFTGSNDVIRGVTKTFAGLAGLVFMLLMISQFIAYFNYSNLPSVIAVTLAGWLEQANIGAIPLLLGFIVVIMLLDIIIPGSLPKWAIFAPIFVPLFIRLGTAPQTVLAAYRVGDSPMNVITPLMVYLPFIITVMQRYRKDSGIGTVIAMMLPYTAIIALAWIILFILWYVLGIPLGPGYPPAI